MPTKGKCWSCGEIKLLFGTLLKAQEPRKGGDGITWWYECGECGTAIDPGDNFCRKCGRAVQWE